MDHASDESRLWQCYQQTAALSSVYIRSLSKLLTNPYLIRISGKLGDSLEFIKANILMLVNENEVQRSAFRKFHLPFLRSNILFLIQF